MNIRKIMNVVVLLLFALVISLVLNAIGMVLPFLFGAMIAAVIYTRFISDNFSYPTWLQSVGLLIIGLEIGSSFRQETLQDMLNDSVNIILITILVIILSLLLTIPLKRMTGCSFETAILASIPGALSQMLLMAEKDKRADLLFVTITQTSRIILVVVIVPFIAQFFIEDSMSEYATETITPFTELGIWSMIILIAGAVLLTLFFSAINFVVPIIMGPLFAALIWNFTIGVDYRMDLELMYIAQILFGTKIGIQIRALLKDLSPKLFIMMMLHNIFLIIGTLVIVVVFVMFTTHGFNNLFLSAAPGGIGQIIIVASEMGSDIAMISSYHIFRIFFIIIVVTPIVNWYLQRTLKREREE